MRSVFAPLAFAAVVAASPMPAAPSASAPDGCSTSYSGTFEIQVVNVTTSSKRDLNKRAPVVCTLSDGVLTDAEGRTGSIVANHQFQFDKLVQDNSIYTSGWSVCSNGSLAIGDDAIFYQCLSGKFYNLYNENIGGQCSPVYIDVIESGSSVASAIPDGQVTASAVVSQQSDGQPTGASAAPVTQISDGQIQASTAVSAVTQISDGQIQAPTSAAAPVTQISDGQIQAPTSTAAPITQISDGQIQAPTGTPITQISDGQIQAPTGAPITQISDGQIQAPTSIVAPITQISDGQIQAPTSTVAPITQISDGQIQAPTSTLAVSPVTQISDGQIQAPATGSGYFNITPTASPSPYIGAAGVVETSFGLGLGAFVLALLL